MNELYLTWATCEAASVSALCHSGCSAPGAPPLEHVQLWQVISLHKIIIETWNFVCMIQTLVRLHSIFFKFFSLLKNCKKNIKTYFQLSDPSQSGLKKIRNKSLNFSYKISFWNCVIYQILHSKKLFWGTLEFVLTWVCFKYDWPPLTFGIVELLKIIFHFFEVFCTVTFVWFRLFHGNNKECLKSFGLVGIGWVLAQSTFWLWAFYFCGLNFPKKMRKKKIQYFAAN